MSRVKIRWRQLVTRVFIERFRMASSGLELAQVRMSRIGVW
jgi:hypothetical protein